MNAEELSNLMKTQIVEIEFRHYRTGERLETKATLDPAYTGSPTIDHDPASEVIAFWDINEENWRSLYVSTILGVTVWNSCPTSFLD